MSTSRDDFGIAFRSALLQRGAAQKFSLIFLLFFATIIFFLDIYGFGFMKPIRSGINDGIFRISLVASSPSRFFSSSNKWDYKSTYFKKRKWKIKKRNWNFKTKRI